MALDIIGNLVRTRDVVNKGNMPYLNQSPWMFSTNSKFKFEHIFRGITYRKFWDWFRTRPELYGVLSVPINDTIGGKVKFTDTEGKPLGRNTLLRAQRFWDDNLMKEVMKSIEFDCYLTGDGYGVKGMISPVRVREIASQLANLRGGKLGFREKDEKNNLANYLYMRALVDEDITATKSYYHMASSTVDVHSDQNRVKYYTQKVYGYEEQRFNVNEVIHFVLERLDGRVDGFTPIQTMVAEMFLLQMVKENMIAFFENGGHPSKIYSLPDVKSMQDPAYTRLVELLRESKKVINSNGSLVYVGNLKVDELGALPKDLEYKDLLMWVISNIAFSFGIPVSSLGFLLSGSGGPSQKGNEAGTADLRYQRRIENRQDYLEDVYNSQLFSKLGFNFRFPRGNMQDRIRETQNRMQLLDSVDKLQTILMRGKLQLKKDSLLRNINGDFELLKDDIEDIPKEENPMNMMPTGNDRQGFQSNNQVQGNQNNLDKSESRKPNANNNNTSS